VMSELDPSHRNLLVALLDGGGQSLITATEADHVPAEAAIGIELSAGSMASVPRLRAA